MVGVGMQKCHDILTQIYLFHINFNGCIQLYCLIKINIFFTHQVAIKRDVSK